MNYQGVLDVLSEYTTELEVMGSGEGYRKSLVDRFNSIRKTVMDKYPDDDIWTQVAEVNEGTGLPEIRLNCNLLNRYLNDLQDGAESKPSWRINRDTEFSGVYNNNVIIESGFTFTCKGVVNGKVTILKGATLINTGVINGGLDIDPEGTFKFSGVLGGEIRVIEVQDM